MSNDDRGTYSPPTEDNLSYETRRPASRDQAPVTLIISGICLVLLLVIVVVLYNSGLNRHGKIAPEVGDSVGDFKDAQVQDAQPLSDSDLSLDAGQTTSQAAGQVTFAPSAEAPALRTPETDVAPPPAAPINGPLPSQAGTAAPSSSLPTSSLSSSSVTAPASRPAASESAPKPAAASASASVTPAASAPKPAASGGTLVQIGAYDTTDIANAEYAKVASSYGLFVGGAGKKIEKVTTPSGTFYRTAFTGLSPDKARAFCSALKANGRDCIIR